VHIGVITINPELPTCQRIRQAGLNRGHEVTLWSLLNFSVSTAADPLLHCGEPIPRFDAGILRLGSQLPGLAVAVGRGLESLGVPLLDSVTALDLARNKFETLQRLKLSGLPVPRTELVRDLDQLAAAVERVGGAPVVVKPLHGSQGQGTILAESAAAAVSMMQSVLFQSREFLLQQYIECAGEDIRVIVVDDEVVTAMKRKAPAGDFRLQSGTGRHRLDRGALFGDDSTGSGSDLCSGASMLRCGSAPWRSRCDDPGGEWFPGIGGDRRGDRHRCRQPLDQCPRKSVPFGE